MAICQVMKPELPGLSVILIAYDGPGFCNGLNPVVDIKFLENVLHVHFDRKDADLQKGSDHCVRFAYPYPIQYFDLARG